MTNVYLYEIRNLLIMKKLTKARNIPCHGKVVFGVYSFSFFGKTLVDLEIGITRVHIQNITFQH